MIRIGSILGLACALAFAPAQQSIRLPAAPANVVTLSAAEWYVLESDSPFVVLASPKGIVTATIETGPIKLKGSFAGGGGKVETRSFAGKYVATIEASGRGSAELFIIPLGFSKESEIQRVPLLVGGAEPKPPPLPPSDDSAPIAGSGFKVLIVYDDAPGALSAGQQAALFGKELRDYLTAKCAAGPDGKTKEFRLFAAGTDVGNESATWQDAMKLKRDALPWIVLSRRESSGKGSGFQGKLPNSAESIFQLIKQFGGE